MLKKYSNSRTLKDNIRLGMLTAIVAGMVNVLSCLMFFSFTSNVTGYFALIMSELSKGNIYQFAIITLWIFAFFFGSFLSNYIVIHFNKKNAYLAHATPIILELLCLLFVGFYGNLYYTETLKETEILILILLFAMGLQNGLTASISNFAVKTTHLTGATTDLAILLSMSTHKDYKHNIEIRNKTKLLLSIFLSYVIGALIASLAYSVVKFKVFYVVSLFLFVVIAYDLYKIRSVKLMVKERKKRINSRVLKKKSIPTPPCSV